MAQQVKGSPELLNKWRRGCRAEGFVPVLDGLRDGLSQERFENDYGDSRDGRFTKVTDEIRNRLAKVAGYRN